MKNLENFEITKKIKGNLPRLPFVLIKEEILGKRYDLSLVFAGDALTRKLNAQFRNKNYIPNVLSFPISKIEGEIFLNPAQIKRQLKKFNKTYIKLVGYMFIHGLFHLKGLTHGSRMESEELRVMKKFNLS